MKKSDEKMERQFFDHCRIILAKKFKVPPDDINIHVIMDCVKRSIRENCNNSEDVFLIKTLTKEEDESLHGDKRRFGEAIVHMIFGGEYPFYNWAEKYQNGYIYEFFEEGHE
jgi:hypothetical protein